MKTPAFYQGDVTHSIGVRPHPRGIARELLNSTAPIETAPPVPPGDDRPLIDHLQFATFGETTSMQFVSDKYALRSLLRKAHCFTIDTETSRLIADFSVAIINDLDGARRLAIPPFPVTWFDIDNAARINRVKQLGIPLTPVAAGDDLIPRCGWLIHPASDLASDGYYMTYCARFNQGCFVAPLSFFWRTGEPTSADVDDERDRDHFLTIEQVTLGVRPTGVHTIDAFPCATPFHLYNKPDRKYASQVYDIMGEIAGELRHVWGLLIALGAGQLGAEAKVAPHPRPTTPPFEAKGKPLFAIEHKVLHIKLSKRTTPEKVAMRAITAAKKRWHEVRGHFRALKNADGTIRARVPVKPHTRGDERLGRVEKTYKVEK